MLTISIYLCTFLLVLDCLFLGLLILIQLPKKEAGAGLAFGGGATDALFGAGTGTALSNLTKYTATAFFVLVFALSVMNNHARLAGSSDLERQFNRMPAPTPPASTAPATPGMTSSNAGIPLSITTNATTATPAPATNQAEKTAK